MTTGSSKFSMDKDEIINTISSTRKLNSLVKEILILVLTLMTLDES